MPQTCTYCKHPKRKEITKRYAEGWSFRRIATHYGGSDATARRHKAHVRDLVRKVKEKDDKAQGKTAYERFIKLMDEAEAKYRDATAPHIQVAWFREWRGMMELGYKLGMEAARESQRYPDMSPAVGRLVERVTESLQPKH